MRTSRMIMLSAPLAVALMAAPVLAHGPGGGDACRQDLKTLCSKLKPTPEPGPGNCVKALCPNMTPGPGAFATCLEGLSGVSAKCKQQLTQMQAKIAARQTAFNTACASDVATFCSNVTTGPWGQIQCLHQAVINNQKVSGTCQTFLAQHHGHGPHGDRPHGDGPHGHGPKGSKPE